MATNNYKEFFSCKKITVMGLGLLGRGLGYTKFLAECGADLIVTDLKTSEQLATSLKALKKFKNPEGKQASNGAGIKYVLGEHRLEDFRDRDMVIKSAGVPLDSIYIAEAKKNNIPIEMDVSLFAKLAPEVTVVGITGTRGKSMTTMLIHHILKENTRGKNIFLGGNIRGVSTLPFLKKVKAGDVLVAELDSWQLQGFGESKISPHISVFTTFMSDHMNYYKGDMKQYFSDKANIFKYQNEGDVLVVQKEVQKLLPKDIKSKVVVANPKDVSSWSFVVPGEHQRANLACAVAVAKVMGVPESKIKKSVKSFKGVEGRLQLLRTYKGIKIYNDNNATTPEATIAGLKALSGVQHPTGLILVCGGTTKKVPLDNFVKALNKYPKKVFLIPGTGTDELLEKIASSAIRRRGGVKTCKAKDFKDAVTSAIKSAKRGDTILFSPAFASFGLFANEYERNDLFVKIIKKLK